VGKNQVFIPLLSLPEDINEDPREKVVIYDKPDDPKFKLKKTKDEGAKPGGLAL